MTIRTGNITLVGSTYSSQILPNGSANTINTLPDTSGTVINTSSTQTMSGKSFDAPTFLNYYKIQEVGSGTVPNPAADMANIYLNAGDGLLHIRLNGPVEDIFTLNDTAQTISNKTLSNATISSLTTAITVAQGGTGATDASTARSNLGLGGLATQSPSSVAITGGTISGVNLSADFVPNFLAFASAGTASAISGYLTLFKDGATDIFKYNTGSGTVRELVNTNLPQTLSSKTITSSAVSSSNLSGNTITGGTVSSLSSAIAVADGGTGATSASGARTNLGLGSLALQDGNNVALTGGTISGLSSLGVSGNLTFSGSARRIIGDFTNATIANQLLFQTSTTNGYTIVSTIPNGTSNDSGYEAHNSQDPDNSAYVLMQAGSSRHYINTNKLGTGTTLPLSLCYEDLPVLSIVNNAKVEISGNLALSGNSRRIIGDFSNTTIANKLLFQTSQTDGYTFLGAIPSAASTSSNWQSGYIAYNLPDPDNSGFISFYAGLTANRINCGKNGTGTTLGLSFDYENTPVMVIRASDILEMSSDTRITPNQAADFKFHVSAYDVDGATYKNFITLTSKDTPTCDISAPSGTTLTLGGAIATNFNLAAQSTPATPSNGLNIFAPSSGATTILNYKDSAGTIHAVVDEQEAQTLFNKTLFEVVVAGYRDSPTSKTSSATLQSSEGYINNTGASGAITLTAPSSPSNGDKIIIRVTVAQNVIFQPNSGQTLANATGTVVSTLTSNTVNSMLVLRYDNTVWATESLTGTWT